MTWERSEVAQSFRERSAEMAYPYKSRVLEKLGVRSWINAKNWSTTIGGNWIDDRVLDAMHEVAKTFVDMHDLYAKADARTAELCSVADAHITTGAGPVGVEELTTWPVHSLTWGVLYSHCLPIRTPELTR